MLILTFMEVATKEWEDLVVDELMSSDESGMEGDQEAILYII